MDHRRSTAVSELEQLRVDLNLALLQIPIGPHRAVANDLSRRRTDVDRWREAEHLPETLCPRAGGDDELLADSDAPAVRLDGGDRVVGAELEPRHLDPVQNL